MTMIKNLDFDYNDCNNHKLNFIYADWETPPYRFLIVRGPCCINAYVGVKEGHPWFKERYPIEGFPEVHGGLTFSGYLNYEIEPEQKWWWLGWDHGHFGDKLLLPVSLESHEVEYLLGWEFKGQNPYNGHWWSPQEIYEELKRVEAQLLDKVNDVLKS